MPVADPAQCISILASLNIDETQAFYVDKLGFSADRHGDYLLVRREAMEIHFGLTTDPTHPRNIACYIRGGQVPGLYTEFSQRAVPGLSYFAVRPWDMKEFYIRDPHGNLLKFGRAPQEV